MYFPYIRGKLFELLGVKELITTTTLLSQNKDKISFVIEPVKKSATLKNTLADLIRNDINFTLIVNPQVGSFADTEEILKLFEDVIKSTNSPNLLNNINSNYQIGIIFHNNIDDKEKIKILEKYKDFVCALTIIHNSEREKVGEILKEYNNVANVRYNIINFSETNRRYYREFDSNTWVEFDDYFKAQKRNSDYLKQEDSSFSDEHLFYRDEGFVGFSDFLTIGEEYSEKGFLPYAVALHISYATDSRKIRVKHFVSDSNDDQADIAGKFSEALAKLIKWADETGHTSIAMRSFRDYDKKGHFPGLGMFKKLSLMNHIDVVLSLI